MEQVQTHLDLSRIPSHIAVIMDGNGRWARERGLERGEGHAAGVNTVRTITEAASRLGVKYLTLYTFSTENWGRPQHEVDTLMHLISMAIERETPDLIRNNVRLRIIGDMSRVPKEVVARLQGCVEATSASTGLNLVLAISYSSRWEITDACRRLAALAAAGHLDPAAITDEDITANLTTAGMPDPDLLIRTGGDRRISNFLLWQIAYAEIVVDNVFWPDFNQKHFEEAIAEYQRRERRYGLTSDQIKDSCDNHSPDDGSNSHNQ